MSLRHNLNPLSAIKKRNLFGLLKCLQFTGNSSDFLSKSFGKQVCRENLKSFFSISIVECQRRERKIMEIVISKIFVDSTIEYLICEKIRNAKLMLGEETSDQSWWKFEKKKLFPFVHLVWFKCLDKKHFQFAWLDNKHFKNQSRIKLTKRQSTALTFENLLV